MDRNKEYTVDDLPTKKSGEVLEILGDKNTRQKLFDLGLIPGTTVKFVRTAPLGDPISINVRGYNLAIRRDVAKKIILKQEG